MRTRLVKYWGNDAINDNHFHDIDYANGMIYLATTYGTYGYRVDSHNSTWDWQNGFHAEAIQLYGDIPVLIGETDFLKLNERSENDIQISIQLPFENLLSKTIKKTLLGGEKIIHKHPSAPFLFKDTRVCDGKLYISYRFNTTKIKDTHDRVVKKSIPLFVLIIFQT